MQNVNTSSVAPLAVDFGSTLSDIAVRENIINIGSEVLENSASATGRAFFDAHTNRSVPCN